MQSVRTQRAAVERLETTGVRVEYSAPNVLIPGWFVRSLGRDHYSSPAGASLLAHQVDFTDRDLLKAIAAELRHLRGLHSLEIVDDSVACNIGEEELEILLTGLDQVQRVKVANMHYSYVTREALLPMTTLPNLIELELYWTSSHIRPQSAALDMLSELGTLQSLNLPWHATQEATRLSQRRGDWKVKLQSTPQWTRGPVRISAADKKVLEKMFAGAASDE